LSFLCLKHRNVELLQNPPLEVVLLLCLELTEREREREREREEREREREMSRDSEKDNCFVCRMDRKKSGRKGGEAHFEYV
jgi:hypothetical protein